MPPSMASCISEVASASLSLLSPMCAPPSPSIDTHSPVEPSLRLGTPGEDSLCACCGELPAAATWGGCAGAAVLTVAFCPGVGDCLLQAASPTKPERESRQ